MVAAVLILYLPPLATDILRRFNGEGFVLVAGRFLLPAYPAVVALVLIGLRQLVPRRYFAWACGALVGLAAAFYWTVYWDTYVHRYFGRRGLGGVVSPHELRPPGDRHGGHDLDRARRDAGARLPHLWPSCCRALSGRVTVAPRTMIRRL